MKPSAQNQRIIGISGCSARTKSVRAMIRQIHEESAQALCLSSHIRNVLAAADRDIRRIDALVLMGNDHDIDPKSYIDRYLADDPRRNVHPKTKNESSTLKGRARAKYEEAMVRMALAIGMPVLGICGGMHRINVICGGTLHQHIPDLVGCDKHMQHRQGIAPHIPVVPIIIKEHTKLAQIACSISMPFATVYSSDCPKVIMENSMHHQAVDRIAQNLRVSAVTDTVPLQGGRAGYLAEALESDPEGMFSKQFILGVQWHPEFGASSLGQKIVQHLIVAANEFSRTRRKIAFRRIFSTQTTKCSLVVNSNP